MPPSDATNPTRKAPPHPGRKDSLRGGGWERSAHPQHRKRIWPAAASCCRACQRRKLTGRHGTALRGRAQAPVRSTWAQKRGRRTAERARTSASLSREAFGRLSEIRQPARDAAGGGGLPTSDSIVRSGAGTAPRRRRVSCNVNLSDKYNTVPERKHHQVHRSLLCTYEIKFLLFKMSRRM